MLTNVKKKKKNQKTFLLEKYQKYFQNEINCKLNSKSFSECSESALKTVEICDVIYPPLIRRVFCQERRISVGRTYLNYRRH